MFLFFWKIQYFKDKPYVEFEISLTLNYCIYQKEVRGTWSMGTLDASVQGVSFYVEKINLASKVIREMALESANFKQKVPSHTFRNRAIKFHYLQVYTL